MNPEVKVVDDVTIVTPHGKLLGGNETDEFQERVKELNEAGNMKLLINLGKTTFMTSVALAVLFLAYVKYTNRGAKVKICSVDKRIQQIFVIVKLTLIYGQDLHDTEEEALAIFRELPVVAGP
jgi:anti-anti-sigma factor